MVVVLIAVGNLVVVYLSYIVVLDPLELHQSSSPFKSPT